MNIHSNDTTLLFYRSRMVALLLALLCSFNVSIAQEFQFLPDVIVQKFVASENPDYTYGTRIHLVTEDLWNNMKQNPGTWSQDYTFKSIANMIKVGINHDAKLVGANFKYRIEVRFKGYADPANPTSAQEGLRNEN